MPRSNKRQQQRKHSTRKQQKKQYSKNRQNKRKSQKKRQTRSRRRTMRGGGIFDSLKSAFGLTPKQPPAATNPLAPANPTGESTPQPPPAKKPSFQIGNLFGNLFSKKPEQPQPQPQVQQPQVGQQGM